MLWMAEIKTSKLKFKRGKSPCLSRRSLTPNFLITMNNQLYTILSHPFYTLNFHKEAAGSGGTPNSLRISFCSAVTSVGRSVAVSPTLISPTLIRRNRSRALLTERVLSRFRINRSICSASTHIQTWALIRSSVQ
jgi:hypothetical protein